MKNKLKYGITLMIISSFTTCTGQLMWKLSEIKANPLLYVFIGFALYGMGALLMMVAFNFGELSVLHPILCVGFILSIFLGHFVLGESISLTKIFGICLIIIGMLFLASTNVMEELDS